MSNTKTHGQSEGAYQHETTLPGQQSSSRKTRWQLLRFAMVGAVNSSVSYASFLFLHWWLGFYLLASVAAYCVGVMVSFFLNRHFVFQAQKRAGQGAAFIVVNGASLLSSTALLYACVDGLGINVYLGQGMAMLVSMTVNFLGYRMVFR